MPSPTLHEFIGGHRDELVRLCVAKMHRRWPDREVLELESGFHALIDEVVRALQEDAGLPVSSPLPGKSETASRHGAERQAHGDQIENIPIQIGMISDSVGELGAREGLRFAAREYQVFNLCIDSAVASALEEFEQRASRSREAEATERIGFIAHELRNALSSGHMAFALLRRGDVGIRGKTGDVLARSLGRLRHLIEQMLLTVRTRSGTPELGDIEVGALLRELADSAVTERGVRVSVDAKEGLVVRADSRLLGSALANLVQNGIKFSREGTEVVLRSRAENDAVAIDVEDACGGLPPGKEEELFRPYVQAGADRRGLGLGLAITREAVEAQGGSIRVRDLPGKGCVFTVVLPHATK